MSTTWTKNTDVSLQHIVMEDKSYMSGPCVTLIHSKILTQTLHPVSSLLLIHKSQTNMTLGNLDDVKSLEPLHPLL